jgi:hypothetical protein
LRAKYLMLKGVQTTDFGIDPYLSMNDASVFFKEASKKFGIELKVGAGGNGEGSLNLVNTTVQIEINESDLANVGFKQYLTANNHLL